MALIADAALDAALNEIRDNVSHVYICNAEPTTYTEATDTYDLGYKAGPTIGAPENGDASGRKIAISAISDGTVTTTGTASHFAMVGTAAGSVLYVARALGTAQALTAGNTFSLTAFDVEFPDPA